MEEDLLLRFYRDPQTLPQQLTAQVFARGTQQLHWHCPPVNLPVEVGKFEKAPPILRISIASTGYHLQRRTDPVLVTVLVREVHPARISRELPSLSFHG